MTKFLIKLFIAINTAIETRKVAIREESIQAEKRHAQHMAELAKELETLDSLR